VEAIPALMRPDNLRVLSKYKVLSRREVESRKDIFLERYIKDVTIEGRLTLRIAKTQILPAAIQYQSTLAQTSLALKELGKKHCTGVLDELCGLVSDFHLAIAELEAALALTAPSALLPLAKHSRDTVLPVMLRVRDLADRLEALVADDLWPLPTYQEILFIK
jgi:glutamine synthetase